MDGWLEFYDGVFVHEIPREDWIEHELSMTCVCGVFIDDSNIIIHNALDGRDNVEELN